MDPTPEPLSQPDDPSAPPDLDPEPDLGQQSDVTQPPRAYFGQPSGPGQPPDLGQQPAFGEPPDFSQSPTYGQPPGPGQPPDLGQQPAFGEPPDFSQSPAYGQPLGPDPGQPSAFERHRTLIILAVIGVALAVGVLATVLTATSGSVNSTLNVRVIVPAPTSAGGLSRDLTDESSPQFQALMTQFQQHFATSLHQHVSSYTAAIYTNAAAGQPASSGSVAVLYLGFNTTGGPQDPASAVQSVFSGNDIGITASVQVPGLPGDTSARCVGGVTNGNPGAACVWATDKTVSIMVSVLPETDTELASLLTKMQPDLIRD